MEKTIKLYTYIDEGKSIEFPSIKEQVEIFAFDYNANRMGGAPSITAKVKHRLCLDNLWTDKVYGEFNGEKYFIMNTPSSSKNNRDEQYEHDIQLLSEREILNHVYFIDVVQENSTIDRPKSNTTKVQFMGDLVEFIGRLNDSLRYSNIGYTAVIDSDITTENRLISFESKYIASALQEAFTQYGIPYYFVGKTIHFGYTENVITAPLKYGRNDALLSISKTNANYQVINRITGMGSSDNIPYYYPNESDDRAAIEASGKKWITPSQNLMPPIYRGSNGEERFYNALNNTYPSPEGGYYDFENEYESGKQKEGKIDFPEIKPSIVGMANAAGKRIDQFIDIAYDEHDDDSYDEDKNEYTHSYFFAKMRKTDGDYGFNLFDQANEKQTMQVSMTSGVCGACTFEIGVGEKTQKNIVQVDASGNLRRDENGNVIRSGEPQPQQNDTRNNEVWIALKKNDTTYPTFKPMPNATANLRPSINDTFVLLGITMPQAYITSAENKLKDSLIKYMYMNNREKFNISIKFSRIYFAEHPEVLAQLNENSRVLVEYNGNQYTLYIDDYSYKMNGSDSLPEIEVNLVDTLTIGKSSLQTALDSVKQDIISSIGGADFLKQGLKYFIRKDINDIAKGIIRFSSGAEFGNFIHGVLGGNIDKEGISELKSLVIREILTSPIIQSPDFINGVLGQGFQLKYDKGGGEEEEAKSDEAILSHDGKPIMTSDGKFLKIFKKKNNEKPINKNGYSYLEVDELFVRVKAYFTELEIKKLSHAGGNWIFSPAGMECSDVEYISNNDSYKCHFISKDKDREVENQFRIDDQVMCKEFNIKKGTSYNAQNRYYWMRCISVGDDWIELSAKSDDKDIRSNSIPMKGDSIVTLGNWTDIKRQNAIIISAYGEGSPSITQHQGIGKKHFSLNDTEKIHISPQKNKFTGEFVFDTGESVKKYISDNNSTIITEASNTAVSMVDGKIQAAINTNKTYTNNAISDSENRIEESTQTKISAIDGKIEAAVNDAQEYTNVKIDGYTETFKKYTDSSIDVLKGEVSSKVSEDVYAKDKNGIEHKISSNGTKIEQHAKDISLQANSISDIDGRVKKNTSYIELNSKNISLKVSQDDVDKSIDNIKIGARNLLRNSRDVKIIPKESKSVTGNNENLSCFDSGLWMNNKPWKNESKWKMFPSFDEDSNDYAYLSLTVDIKNNTQYMLSIGSSEIISGNDTSSYSVALIDIETNAIINYCSFTIGKDRQVKSFITPNIINDTSNIKLIIFAGKIGESKGRSMSFNYIQLEEGNKDTQWTEAPEDNVSTDTLLPTGIDIENKKITLTADKTFIQDNHGIPIAIFSSNTDDGIQFNSNVYATYVRADKGTIGGFTISDNSLQAVNGRSTVTLGLNGIKVNTENGGFSAGIGGIGFTGNPTINLDGGVISSFKMLVSRATLLTVLQINSIRYNGIYLDGRPIDWVNNDNIVIDMSSRSVSGYRFLIQIIDYSGTCQLTTGGYYDSGGGWHNDNIVIKDRKAREFIFDGLKWHEHLCSN